jgi:hypothetical protein
MAHLDPRYQNAKKEILKLLPEIPQEAPIVRAYINKLATVLRNRGPDVSKYQTSERNSKIARRRGFDMKSTRAYKYFEALGWNAIPRTHLCGLVKIMAKDAGILHRLDRDAKREKCILFQWLDENWELLEPYANRVILEIADNDTTQTCSRK